MATIPSTTQSWAPFTTVPSTAFLPSTIIITCEWWTGLKDPCVPNTTSRTGTRQCPTSTGTSSAPAGHASRASSTSPAVMCAVTATTARATTAPSPATHRVSRATPARRPATSSWATWWARSSPGLRAAAGECAPDKARWSCPGWGRAGSSTHCVLVLPAQAPTPKAPRTAKSPSSAAALTAQSSGKHPSCGDISALSPAVDEVSTSTRSLGSTPDGPASTDTSHGCPSPPGASPASQLSHSTTGAPSPARAK
mmetsp:Transcript_56535/g.123936  ORF Transcript_56535/g.123936 Transcript_56535/m.123936 type:complete len:253 (-) Transcript_56535:205-963(-)